MPGRVDDPRQAKLRINKAIEQMLYMFTFYTNERSTSRIRVE